MKLYTKKAFNEAVAKEVEAVYSKMERNNSDDFRFLDLSDRLYHLEQECGDLRRRLDAIESVLKKTGGILVLDTQDRFRKFDPITMP